MANHPRTLTLLAIRLPADLEQRLAVLAERTGRTKTFHAREAIEKVIRDASEAAERKATRDARYAARKARLAKK